MDITNPVEIRKQLKAQRDKLELSQEAVARRADISTNKYGQVERTGMAKVSTLAKIADALGIRLTYGSSRRSA